MDGIQSLLGEMAARFARYERPGDYINRAHCCECEEHYIELLEVTAADLRKEHVGDGGWDPTAFLTPDGFRYYLPGMARIATEDRYWLAMLTPRLGLWFTDTLDENDRALLLRLLEAWWADGATDDDARLDIERAIDRLRGVTPSAEDARDG